MTACPKLRISLLLAALAAVSAPALADTVVIYPDSASTETYYVAPATGYYVEPATTTTYYYEPPVIVTAPRETDDQLINDDVMDALASDASLHGAIGVDTYRGTVRLNGRVTTTGQVERAADDAWSVDGVRDVRNGLRARVGDE